MTVMPGAAVMAQHSRPRAVSREGDGQAAAIDGKRPEVPGAFRRVLKEFPTGVVAITASDGEPVGLTIGSFVSISLGPPLVGFFVDRSSTTWPRIRRAGAFAVNALGEDHEKLCRRFAAIGHDRFADVSWTPGYREAPLLAGALAWIECDVSDVVASGDHYLVVGGVRRLEVGPTGSPLVFFRGQFARLAPDGEAALAPDDEAGE
jgi:3-hydroxy-9,10-secoandrosta-1,3,5(10)-triene-9,17-dione monooxygenase reductase component